VHARDGSEFAEKLVIPQRTAAEINARDKAGRLSLMGQLLEPDADDNVLAPLDAGADPAARDSNEVMVMDYARKHGPDLLAIVRDALE
jgi:ankyrin repeat protein